MVVGSVPEDGIARRQYKGMCDASNYIPTCAYIAYVWLNFWLYVEIGGNSNKQEKVGSR